jgi:hypothetical protein
MEPPLTIKGCAVRQILPFSRFPDFQTFLQRSAVRQFLEVKPFDDEGKTLLRQTFGEAALIKEDVIDIINIDAAAQEATTTQGERV